MNRMVAQLSEQSNAERPDEPERDPEIRFGVMAAAEQVRLVYRSVLGQIANVVNPAIVIAVLYTSVRHDLLFGWFGLMVLSTLGRLLLMRAYRVAAPRPSEAPVWGRRFAVGAGITGVLWAMLSAVVFLTDAGVLHAFLAFLAAGMTAGAVTASAAYVPAFYAFALPINLMLATSFLLRGDPVHLAMAAMVFLFAALTGAIARNWNRTIRNSILLGLRNENLVRRLSVQRDRAERASRAKTDFLANMSHELRTPLNAIIGFSEAIKREMFGPIGRSEYREYAEDIHASGLHLHELIGGVLDVAKAERGEMTLEESTVDLIGAVEATTRMIRQEAERAGVAVEWRGPETLPALRADRRLIRQVLLNLISNSIKFSNRDSRIEIDAALMPEGLVLTVSDTGIGMERDEVERAFEPFNQLARDPSKRRTGTGLGLPLSRRIMELHGGSLHLVSSPGQGTKAAATFPHGRIVHPPRVA